MDGRRQRDTAQGVAAQDVARLLHAGRQRRPDVAERSGQYPAQGEATAPRHQGAFWQPRRIRGRHHRGGEGASVPARRARRHARYVDSRHDDPARGDGHPSPHRRRPRHAWTARHHAAGVRRRDRPRRGTSGTRLPRLRPLLGTHLGARRLPRARSEAVPSWLAPALRFRRIQGVRRLVPVPCGLRAPCAQGGTGRHPGAHGGACAER